MCRVAKDPFLEKCLVSLITPLFAFVHIRFEQQRSPFQFVQVAERHEQIVKVIRGHDYDSAARTMRQAMAEFREAVIATVCPISDDKVPMRPSAVRRATVKRRDSKARR